MTNKKQRMTRCFHFNWSKRRESDPHVDLGKVAFYH